MSTFFTEAALRRMAMASRAVSQAARFGTTYIPRKSVTESAKDTLKSVDRKLSDKLVDGINVGTKAAETISGKSSEANYKSAGTAEEIRKKMKAESEELAGKAKRAAEETGGMFKDAAKKAEGKLKDSV
ncbi:hypothetical protein GGS21DRAFT_524038 [Xylaria nigripes]|nr:hypothetical protein GGS21DRAFT_524038 [Xylaria nigripes]